MNSQVHTDLRLQVRNDYRFATGSNSVALTTVEFTKACHEYPIVFVQQADTVSPVAVLGLKDRQNLFVDEKGQWSIGSTNALF